MKTSFPPAAQSLTATLSGPAGFPHTSFLLNVRRFVDDGYLWGTRTFRPTDTSNFGTKNFLPTGDNAAEPMGNTDQWSGQIKISNRPLGDIQISYQAIGDYNRGKDYSFAYRFNPDGARKQTNFPSSTGSMSPTRSRPPHSIRSACGRTISSTRIMPSLDRRPRVQCRRRAAGRCEL